MRKPADSPSDLFRILLADPVALELASRDERSRTQWLIRLADAERTQKRSIERMLSEMRRYERTTATRKPPKRP